MRAARNGPTEEFTMRLASAGTVVALLLCSGTAGAQQPAPNGITLPAGYQDWRPLAVSHRTDNDTVRVIIGNDAAVKAAREGKTSPWPDGAILGKLVWKAVKSDAWEAAIVPGDFVHAEFMVKDSKKYAASGGWGFARWLGKEQKPYGAEARFVQECFGCHVPVAHRDYVFTLPAQLPERRTQEKP
jgi:hypothetical protein